MTTLSPARPRLSVVSGPRFIFHPSFEAADASQKYGQQPDENEIRLGSDHLADEQTCEFARRMHYAGYRFSRASSPGRRRHWERRYLAWRDRIVMGNIKLVFKAVRRWRTAVRSVEDATADCQIVFIQAVATFNPWVGIRFSTYAYTCLMRSLSRQTNRRAADRLSRAVSLHLLGDGSIHELTDRNPIPGSGHRLDEYFHENHPLLSDPEKLVLTRRFWPTAVQDETTLTAVGEKMGVSRERVRQLQASGLAKLREVLIGPPLAG